MEFSAEEAAAEALHGPGRPDAAAAEQLLGCEPYEPEYGKYGGPAGVALAEWHFEHSSDLVLDALGTMNVHLRTVVLGLAAQLMMVMAGCFLPDRDELAGLPGALPRVLAARVRGHELRRPARSTTGAYGTMAPELARRFGTVRGARPPATRPRLPGVPARLGRALPRAAGPGHATGRPRRAGLPALGTATGTSTSPTPDAALAMLLSPYLHMTNNRLHVTIRDEAYLSYVLARALREPEVAPARPVRASGHRDRPGHAKPARRPELRLSGPLLHGPAVVHLVKDPASGRTFEVGPKEHFVIARLDGTRTLGEIGDEYAGRLRRPARRASTGASCSGCWAAGGCSPAAARRRKPAAPPRSTVLDGRVRLVRDPAALVDRLHRAAAPLLRRPALVALVGLLLAMLAVLAADAPALLDGTGGCSGSRPRWSRWPCCCAEHGRARARARAGRPRLRRLGHRDRAALAAARGVPVLHGGGRPVPAPGAGSR